MNSEIEEAIFNKTISLIKKYGLNESDIDRLANILAEIAHNYYGDKFNSEDIDEIDYDIKHDVWLEPNILSYFDEIPKNKVFEIFENNNINDLIALEYFFIDLDLDFLYTYEELVNIIKPFIEYLSSNRNSIISTGFPLKSFDLNDWIHNNLSNLYPLKHPFAILRKEKDKDGNILLEYHWIKKPGNLFNSSDLKRQDFFYASYNSRYSFADIDFIENKRPMLFDLKIDILNILFDALLEKNCIGLWEKCIKCIANKIELEDFKYLIQRGGLDFLSGIYYERNYQYLFKKYNIKASDNCFKEGGLTEIIELIFQVEKELRLGHVNKIKNKLIALSKNVIISTYYELLVNIDLSELTSIGMEFRKYQKEEDKYRDFFKKRLSNDLKKSFKTSLTEKPNRTESIEPIINSLINKINSKTDFSGSKNVYKTNIKNIIPIKLPPGTKWDQIVIQFIDNESVEISGPKNFREVRSFREMGFENRKKLGRPPNKLWVFLWALAKVKGTFSWDLLDERMRNSEIIKDAMNTATKRKQLVMQKLKEFFNLEEDPIIYYRKTKIYQTQFHIMLQHESD